MERCNIDELAFIDLVQNCKNENLGKIEKNKRGSEKMISETLWNRNHLLEKGRKVSDKNSSSIFLVHRKLTVRKNFLLIFRIFLSKETFLSDLQNLFLKIISVFSADQKIFSFAFDL